MPATVVLMDGESRDVAQLVTEAGGARAFDPWPPSGWVEWSCPGCWAQFWMPPVLAAELDRSRRRCAACQVAGRCARQDCGRQRVVADGRALCPVHDSLRSVRVGLVTEGRP